MSTTDSHASTDPADALVDDDEATMTEPHATEGAPEQSEGPRWVGFLETYVVVLIAVVAAAAASTTWRAEVAGTKAAHSNQQGVAIDIGVAGEQLNDRLDALNGAQRVTNVQALRDERDAAVNQASAGGGQPPAGLADQPDQTAFTGPAPPVRDPVGIAAFVAAQTYEWELRSTWDESNYVQTDNSGRWTFDTENAAADEVISREIPADFTRRFDLAEGFEHHRLLLLYVDMALVAALAFAAVAHVIRSIRCVIVLTAVSTLTFFAAVACLLALEV